MDSNNQRTTTYVSVSIQHDKIGVHMCRLTNIKLSGNTLHAIHVVSHAQDRDDLSSYYFFSARRLFINRVPNYWRIFCGTNTFNVWLSVPDLRLRTSTSFVFLCAIVLLYCFFFIFPSSATKKNVFNISFLSNLFRLSETLVQTRCDLARRPSSGNSAKRPRHKYDVIRSLCGLRCRPRWLGTQ